MDEDAYEMACQRRMETALNSVRTTLKAQDADIAAIKVEQAAHAAQLKEGTQLMRGLDEKLTELREVTKPVTEAVENMQAGVRVLGKIGRFSARLGEWGWKVVRVAAFFAGLWFFIKSILLGQPFSAAWADLVRYIK